MHGSVGYALRPVVGVYALPVHAWVGVERLPRCNYEAPLSVDKRRARPHANRTPLRENAFPASLRAATRAAKPAPSSHSSLVPWLCAIVGHPSPVVLMLGCAMV